MPLAIKTKTTKIKVPKLSTQTGWLLYSQEFVTDKKAQLLNYSSSLTKRSKMRVRMKRRMALSVQKISRRLLRSSVLNLRLKLRATLDSRSSILLKFYELRLGGCGRKLIRRNTTRRPRSLTLRASRNGETLTKIAMASSCYLLKTSSPRLWHLDLILRR